MGLVPRSERGDAPTYVMPSSGRFDAGRFQIVDLCRMQTAINMESKCVVKHCRGTIATPSGFAGNQVWTQAIAEAPGAAPSFMTGRCLKSIRGSMAPRGDSPVRLPAGGSKLYGRPSMPRRAKVWGFRGKDDGMRPGPCFPCIHARSDPHV